jgi:hypothetical protein
MNYDGLIAMIESDNDDDMTLAEGILMKMDLDEISEFLIYWGSQKVDKQTFLRPSVFDHLCKLHKEKRDGKEISKFD